MDNLLNLFLYISISLCSVNTSLGYVVHVVTILPYEDYIYLFDQVHDFWSLKEDWQIFRQIYLFWIINFSKIIRICVLAEFEYWNLLTDELNL